MLVRCVVSQGHEFPCQGWKFVYKAAVIDIDFVPQCMKQGRLPWGPHQPGGPRAPSTLRRLRYEIRHKIYVVAKCSDVSPSKSYPCPGDLVLEKSLIVRLAELNKVVQYSITSVGQGADTGFLAVSPQVTSVSDKPVCRLPWLAER